MKHKQIQSEANIIRQFDKQIRYELYEFMYMHKCPSYWGKKLFIETIDFNVYNWKIIQTDQYLLEKTKYKDAELYEFMYEKALEHKKRLVKVDNVMYYDVP
jgi:hypothetical protein